jgi:hypothetical protein
VREQIFPLVVDARTSILLAGAAMTEKGSLRAELAKAFKRPPLNRFYRLVYPEEVFEEMVQEREYDLLKLENLLASGVRAVVLCPESPGSIAELGAFANHSELSKRLVVLVKAKYRNSSGFIRLGPIRLLEKHSGSIIWVDKATKFNDLIAQVKSSVLQKGPPPRSLLNPIVAESFVLPFLFVAEPLEKTEILDTVGDMEPSASHEARIACSAALEMLIDKRAVLLDEKKYYVTKSGTEAMITAVNEKSQKIKQVLDGLRVEVLNYRLRSRPRRK